MSAIAVMGVGIVAVAVMIIISYNRFVRLHALLDEDLSSIKIQLKRRGDLVVHLIALVQEHGGQESELLERIKQMRLIAQEASTVAGKASVEAELTSIVKTLFAITEANMDLKNNHAYVRLQDDIRDIEWDVQAARREYNATARDYNAALVAFPSNVMANLFGFSRADYFEAIASDRDGSRVSF